MIVLRLVGNFIGYLRISKNLISLKSRYHEWKSNIELKNNINSCNYYIPFTLTFN